MQSGVPFGAMNYSVDQDVIHSHGYINYAYAGLQGKFAYINILNQTGHPLGAKLSLTEVQDTIAKVREWMGDLAKGEAVLAARWERPETFDAMRILEILRGLRSEYIDIAGRCTALTSSPDLPQKPDEVKHLVAFYGRYAYSHDNYVRGFIDFGTNSNRPQITELYTPYLEGTNAEIAAAHSFFEAAKQPAKWSQEFFNALYDQSLFLPSIYRTYVHDISQLVAQFEGGFSYQSAGFSAGEIAAWSNSGFGAVPAGYWRAYDFIPEQAVEWQRYNITDPAMAADWRKHGFSATSALPWFQRGFYPSTAREWANANHDPERAAQFLEKGLRTPSDVP